MNLLKIENLAKSYGDKVALTDVSLQVKSGEVFGLLGPNGAGKTTLIRILMDIIRPDQGTVTLFEEPFHRGLLDRIAYLPEERGLYKKQRVSDCMSYFGQLQGLSAKQARHQALHWLRRMDLEETFNWKVEQLSKGMSQKVQIAVTLMADPELCILDEPFSGLDPVNLRLVLELIQERRQAGLTTILSTHQMNLVETLCDRVGLIHQGKLVLYGEVEEVRRRHSQPEVTVQLGAAPPVLAGVSESKQIGSDQWRLRLLDQTLPQQVLNQLVQEGCEIRRFESVLTPIEDVFVRVVRGESS